MAAWQMKVCKMIFAQYRYIDWSSAPKTLSYNEEFAKIGPVDPEIVVPWAIIKERKKVINASKICSPSGKFAE